MKNKKIFATLLLLPLLGGLVSCNSDLSSEGSGNGSQNSGGGNSSMVDPADGLPIYFWHTSGQTVTTELENIIEDFEALVLENEGKKINIILQYQGSYDDQLQKITTAFSTGDQPTLAIAYPDHVAEYLSLEDTPGQYVQDLSEYIDDPEIGFGKEEWIGDGAATDFVEAFYDEGSGYAKEGIYSLPIMKSTEVMYYNATVVVPLAMEYNEELTTESRVQKWLDSLSWDEFMDFCRYIRDQGGLDGLEWPCFYDSDSNLYITQSMQKEIPFLSYKADGKGSVDFNNDQAKSMVRELKALYDEKLLCTKGTTGEYGSNYFTQEQCVFDIGSSGGAGYNYPTGGGFEVGVCRVPAFNKDNALYVTQGLTATILKARDDTDGSKALYAFKFLKYLTSTDVNTQICVNGSEGYVPVRKSCYETPLFETFISSGELIGNVADIVTGDINGNYFNTPCFKGSATARDAVGGIITQVFAGEKTIDEAFSDAENTTLNQM